MLSFEILDMQSWYICFNLPIVTAEILKCVVYVSGDRRCGQVHLLLLLWVAPWISEKWLFAVIVFA